MLARTDRDGAYDPFARTIGAGCPSIVAVQPGANVSLTTSQAVRLAVVSSTRRSGSSWTTATRADSQWTSRERQTGRFDQHGSPRIEVGTLQYGESVVGVG